MNMRELAPALFVGLFVLTGLAIVGELVLIVITRVARARRSTPPGGLERLRRIRRIPRIAAPVGLLGAGAILAWLSTSPPQASTPEHTDAELPVSIDETGIGAATVGSTLGRLRATLAPGAAIGDPSGRFMVDVTALPVVADTDTLYHLLFPTGTSIDEESPLELVATTHPLARTAAGVGPGTPLAEAADVYGHPTLSYSVHDESREYARFPRQPGDRILFRVAPAPGLASLAGSYTTDAEYNETTVFDPEARIVMVLLRLRAEATSGAAPPP